MADATREEAREILRLHPDAADDVSHLATCYEIEPGKWCDCPTFGELADLAHPVSGDLHEARTNEHIVSWPETHALPREGDRWVCSCGTTGVAGGPGVSANQHAAGVGDCGADLGEYGRCELLVGHEGIHAGAPPQRQRELRPVSGDQEGTSG